MMDESDLHDHSPPDYWFYITIIITTWYSGRSYELSLYSSPESWWAAAFMMVLK